MNRLAAMEATVEFSPALFEVDEAVAVLDYHDQRDLKSVKDSAEDKVAVHEAFVQEFVACRKANNVKTGAGAVHGGPKPAGVSVTVKHYALSATISQSDAKKFVPPTCHIWRDLTRGGWA
eukprot:599360-Karenia_brevis.AAC.1